MGTKQCTQCGNVYTKSIKYFPKSKMFYNKKSDDPFKPERVYYISTSRICINCVRERRTLSNEKYDQKIRLRRLNRMKDGLNPELIHENLQGSIWFCVTSIKYYESESEMEKQDYSGITQEEIESILNKKYF